MSEFLLLSARSRPSFALHNATRASHTFFLARYSEVFILLGLRRSVELQVVHDLVKFTLANTYTFQVLFLLTGILLVFGRQFSDLLRDFGFLLCLHDSGGFVFVDTLLYQLVVYFSFYDFAHVEVLFVGVLAAVLGHQGYAFKLGFVDFYGVAPRRHAQFTHVPVQVVVYKPNLHFFQLMRIH